MSTTLRDASGSLGEVVASAGGAARRLADLVGRALTGGLGLVQAAVVGSMLAAGYVLVVVEFLALSTLVTVWRATKRLVGIGDDRASGPWATDVMDDRPSVARVLLTVGVALGIDLKRKTIAVHRRRPVLPGLVTAAGGAIIGYIPMMVALDLALVPHRFMYAGAIFSLVILLSGLFSIRRPEFSTYFGALSILVAVLSIVGALGGFFVGLLVACFGGSLLVAWEPPEDRDPSPTGPSSIPTGSDLETGD